MKALAPHSPRQIIFTGRNAASAQKIIKELGADKVSFIPCDMNSLDSVKKAADTFLEKWDRLDIFIANAGISTAGPEAGLTKDGYEPIFQVDHVSHALFIQKILPTLSSTAKSTGSGRLVMLSSLLHAQAPKGGIDYEGTRKLITYTAGTSDLRRYGAAKLANLLYGQEIARRYPDITAVSIHPGVVWTEMNNQAPWYVRFFLRTFAPNNLQPNEGAYNSLWSATTPKANINSGGYYDVVGVPAKTAPTVTEEAGRRLWVWTEEAIKAWL